MSNALPSSRAVLLLLVGFLSLVVPRTLAADDKQPPDWEPIVLWPNGAPGAVGNEELDRPLIGMHKPQQAKPNGCAVIVCPGGGYGHLADTYEGHDVARWFNSFGVTSFVLRYRLAPRYKHPAPLNDVQRAVRTVRASAAQWGIDPNRIGVMGFSAGGHLTSTAGTHFDSGQADAADPIDRVSSRPDFLIMAYPVVSFTSEFTHKGSVKNLLGDNPDPRLVEFLSSEKQVTPQTPPAFLFHTSGDKGVPAENSIAFYLALHKAGVPVEMHVFEPGNHGVGLGGAKEPAVSDWPNQLKHWMQHRGYLGKQ